MIHTFPDRRKTQFPICVECYSVCLGNEIAHAPETAFFCFQRSTGEEFSGDSAALIFQRDSHAGEFHRWFEGIRPAGQEVRLRVRVEGDDTREIMVGLCL